MVIFHKSCCSLKLGVSHLGGIPWTHQCLIAFYETQFFSWCPSRTQPVGFKITSGHVVSPDKIKVGGFKVSCLKNRNQQVPWKTNVSVFHLFWIILIGTHELTTNKLKLWEHQKKCWDSEIILRHLTDFHRLRGLNFLVSQPPSGERRWNEELI